MSDLSLLDQLYSLLALEMQRIKSLTGTEHLLQSWDLNNHTSDFGSECIELLFGQARTAARLLQYQADIGVNEGAHMVALGRLIHRAELRTVHQTSQSLLVILANISRGSLLLLLITRGVILMSLHIRGRHRHLGSLGSLGAIILVLALVMVLVSHGPPLVALLTACTRLLIGIISRR